MVTGGHRFDVPNFHGVVSQVGRRGCLYSVSGGFCLAHEQQERDFYDAVVFYNMHKEGPTDEVRSGWMGRPLSALESWLARARVWCCAPRDLAFPDWDPWVQMAGVVAGSF